MIIRKINRTTLSKEEKEYDVELLSQGIITTKEEENKYSDSYYEKLRKEFDYIIQ